MRVVLKIFFKPFPSRVRCIFQFIICILLFCATVRASFWALCYQMSTSIQLASKKKTTTRCDARCLFTRTWCFPSTPPSQRCPWRRETPHPFLIGHQQASGPESTVDYRFFFLPPRRMELHLKTAGRNRYIGLNVEETEDFDAYQYLTFFLNLCIVNNTKAIICN